MKRLKNDFPFYSSEHKMRETVYASSSSSSFPFFIMYAFFYTLKTNSVSDNTFSSCFPHNHNRMVHYFSEAMASCNVCAYELMEERSELCCLILSSQKATQQSIFLYSRSVFFVKLVKERIDILTLSSPQEPFERKEKNNLNLESKSN